MLLSKILLAITAATMATALPLSSGALKRATHEMAGVDESDKQYIEKRTSSWVGVDIGSVFSVSSGSISNTASQGTYKVVSGDTGSVIANKLGVSLSSLSTANPGVNWSNMLVGQPIIIPGSSSVPGNTNTSGGQDIADAIAAEVGVTTSSLTTANPNVDWYSLSGGQTVQVPQSDGTTVPFTLSLGDMGQTIADSLGIAYAQLIAANPGVDFSNLQPGQSINVPSDVAQIIDPTDYPSGSDVSTTNLTTDTSSSSANGSVAGSDAGSDTASAAGSDDGSDTQSDAGSDTASDAGSDDGSDTASNAGSDDGSDTASNAGSDDGSDTASNAGSDDGSDTASNAGSDDGSDTASNAGSDSGSDNGSTTSSSRSGMRFRKRLNRLAREEATRWTVQQGQTAQQIAVILGVPYQALVDVNPEVDMDSLSPGQILRIPRIADIQLRDRTRYTVEEGQTPFEIAQELDVPLEALEDVNPDVDFGDLHPGQMLRVPINRDSSS